jgi:peptide/nickel transport system ATP-binding protein
MLIAKDLVAGYRPGQPVLGGLSIQLEAGRTVGLLGPSGCGKSTLVRVLALLQAPWSGAVEIDGTLVRVSRYAAPASLRRQVGVIFQQPRLSVDPRFTLRQAISQGLRAPVVGEVGGVVGEVGGALRPLADLVDLSPELLERRPHEVSEGQLQRACVARAFAVQPRYLLCDEMTAMLDASTTAALVRMVRRHSEENGTGVLAVSHDETLLSAWCDDVIEWDELVTG